MSQFNPVHTIIPSSKINNKIKVRLKHRRLFPMDSALLDMWTAYVSLTL
jgi:hypothetical protein